MRKDRSFIMSEYEDNKKSRYLSEEEFNKELNQQINSVFIIFDSYNKRKKVNEKTKEADIDEER